MAGERAMFTGADNIMNAFDTLRPDTSYFSVWQGRDLLYQYNDIDLQKGRQVLDDMMSAAEDQGNTDLLFVKFHPRLKGGFITGKSEVIGTLKVRPCGFDTNDQVSGVPVQRGNDIPNSVYHMMKSINETLPLLQTKITALEAASNAPVERDPDIFDRISGIIEKPGVVDGLVSLLGPIINRLVPGMPPPNLQVNGTSPATIAQKIDMGSNIAQKQDTGVILPGNIAENKGVGQGEIAELSDSDNEVIDDALARLSEYCDIVECLPLLADYATENTAMFNILIQQLKPRK